MRAWWSDDLVHWHTAQQPALMYPAYPFNTDVTPVVNKSLLTRPDGSRAIVDTGSLAGHCFCLCPCVSAPVTL
eukprot:COSAG03_NODE_1535_length_3911_cov_10.802466_2_plen_73_part_00